MVLTKQFPGCWDRICRCPIRNVSCLLYWAERGDVDAASIWQFSEYVTLCESPGLASCGLQAESGPPSVFVNKVLLQHSHAHDLESVAAFALSQQSWVMRMETTWPMKLKVFTFWPFTEEVCQPQCETINTLSYRKWVAGGQVCS